MNFLQWWVIGELSVIVIGLSFLTVQIWRRARSQPGIRLVELEWVELDLQVEGLRHGLCRLACADQRAGDHKVEFRAFLLPAFGQGARLRTTHIGQWKIRLSLPA